MAKIPHYNYTGSKVMNTITGKMPILRSLLAVRTGRRFCTRIDFINGCDDNTTYVNACRRASGSEYNTCQHKSFRHARRNFRLTVL